MTVTVSVTATVTVAGPVVMVQAGMATATPTATVTETVTMHIVQALAVMMDIIAAMVAEGRVVGAVHAMGCFLHTCTLSTCRHMHSV